MSETGITDNQPATVYKEPCPRCSGSGRYHGFSKLGGACLKCDGLGYHSFTTSPEQRERVRQVRVGRKLEKQTENLARVEANYPDLAEWWNVSKFEFAVSLKQAARDFGALSENQVRSARRCIKGQAERVAARAESEKLAVTVSIQPIIDVFARAKSNGVESPKIRLMGEGGVAVELSVAGAMSVNRGAIYVKIGADYMGKIGKAQKFETSGHCTTEKHAAILGALASPLDAAKKFGLETGICSCCARKLTNPKSIEAGIGPICESNYF